ncbi:hypothetical protein [Arthrobacter castelli]|uniref:hypothetical protein n=1 Tax=Arthrobacter castelli TaxID=271431 RepID=UPI000407C5C0|nr:hypothetical protein [Arthrobacter castelli]
MCLNLCGQSVDVLNQDAGVSFLLRLEILFDAQVDLEIIGSNPKAASSGKYRRFSTSVSPRMST